MSCAHACRCGHQSPFEAEWQAIVNCLVWVLGTKCGCFASAQVFWPEFTSLHHHLSPYETTHYMAQLDYKLLYTIAQNGTSRFKVKPASPIPIPLRSRDYRQGSLCLFYLFGFICFEMKSCYIAQAWPFTLLSSSFSLPIKPIFK